MLWETAVADMVTALSVWKENKDSLIIICVVEDNISLADVTSL